MTSGTLRKGKWNVLAGVGLTSLSTLMLQVCLMRLFSVALWHHFAFMVVSIAFLGFSGSGTILMMFPGIKRLRQPAALSHLALGFSAATLAAYGFSNSIAFDPARIPWDRYQWLYLLCTYCVLAVPFIFAGLIPALVYTITPGTVNRFYAFDLAGAGTGCLAALFIYAAAGETGTIIVVCFIAGLASIAFQLPGWKLNALRAPWMLLLCFLLLTGPGFLELNISPYKALSVALRHPGARILETHHDLSARLDVIKSSAVRFFPGLSLEFEGSFPEQLGICLDGGHLAAVTRFTGNPDELKFTAYLPAALPYAVHERPHVLILEPLGGLDILTALYHGAEKITTTHSTPLFLNVMEGSLSEYSGQLYSKNVLAVEEEARVFFHRSEERFDLIQLPLTDSTGAGSSGLYGLSEEYSLTVEAFQSYLNALTAGGVLAVTRYLLPPPRHELRLAALAKTALEAIGVEHPHEHVAAIRSWGTFTLMVKKTPLASEEIKGIKDFCRRLHFDLIHYPGMQRSEANKYNRFPGPLYHDLVQKILGSGGDEGFFESHLFDVRPVTDDKPFFYHNFRADRLFELYRAVGHKWQLFLEGGYLVHVIFFQALVIALILVALPLTRGRVPGSLRFLVYFGLIGTAFMLTEICLVQKFILFLSRPAYAFSAVLFSVLLAAGLGSHASRKLLPRAEKDSVEAGVFGGRLLFLAGAPVAVFVYGLVLDRFLMTGIFLPLWLRYAIVFFVVLPVGFFMGMFFPVGIRVLSYGRSDAIPWAWSVNAGASVVASVMAVVIALSWGFTTVLFTAGLIYALALIALWMMARAGSGTGG